MTTAVLRSNEPNDFKSPLDTRPILYVRHILLRNDGEGRKRILTVQANDPGILDALVRVKVAKLAEGWRVVY